MSLFALVRALARGLDREEFGQWLSLAAKEREEDLSKIEPFILPVPLGVDAESYAELVRVVVGLAVLSSPRHAYRTVCIPTNRGVYHELRISFSLRNEAA